MSSNRPNELHVGSGGYETRQAGVPEVVQAVPRSVRPATPSAGYQTRWLKFDGCSGVPRIEPKTSSSGASRPCSTARAASSRNAASTYGQSGTKRTSESVFGPPEPLTRVGGLDADQPTLAVRVPPAKGAELAEAKPCPEHDVEEEDEEEVGLVAERIERREVDERLPDRLGVLSRDLPAGKVLPEYSPERVVDYLPTKRSSYSRA